MSRNPPKDRDPKSPEDKPRVVPQQIALLEGIDGTTLQSRFEEFCQVAVDALTLTNTMGDPVIEAGKGKAEFAVKVKIERVANDSMTFAIAHEVNEKLPKVPGVVKTAPLVVGVGLAQRVSLRQYPLFDPAGGQPRPLSKEEAEGNLGAEPPERKPRPEDGEG